MSQSFRKVLFIICIGLLIILSIGFEYGGPKVVEHLYSQEKINVLNQWLDHSQREPLNFYLGSMEERIFGPLSILCSTLAFFIFAFVFLNQAGRLQLCFAVFVYLVITKFEVLLFPPYGDSASGPFAEAIWLYHHGFNYAELAKQPGFIEGGPKVYLISLYPTVMAFLMKMITHTKTFIVFNHLLVFAQAAVIITIFREMLTRLCSRNLALLVSLVILSLPLFSSQVEQINMEIPTLFFATLSIYFLSLKNLKVALAMGMLAAMIKIYAVIVPATIFVIGLYLFLFDEQKRHKPMTLIWSLAAALFCGVMVYLDYMSFNVKGDLPRVGFLEGWDRLKNVNILFYYLYSLGAFVILFFLDKVRNSQQPFKVLMEKRFTALISFILVAGWIVLFINSGSFVPRYALLIAPFCVVCIFYVVQSIIRFEKLLFVILVGFLSFFAISSYGKFNHPKNSRIHAVLERNLEYRNDLELHRLLAKRIERNYSAYTISAPFTVAQKLALPELGYVQKKLDVMIYEFPCSYGGIKNFKGLKHVDVGRTIWVDYKAALTSRLAEKIPYPVDPMDRVIEEIVWGGRTAKLFRGGIAVEKAWRILLWTLAQKKT